MWQYNKFRPDEKVFSSEMLTFVGVPAPVQKGDLAPPPQPYTGPEARGTDGSAPGTPEDVTAH